MRAQSSPAGATELAAALDTVAAIGGEPRIVSGAGMTRDDVPLLTLENGAPFDASRSERRLVMVGGLDGDADAARIVLDALRWFKTEAPEAERARWLVSALPLALPGADAAGPPAIFPPVDGFFDHPERPESRYVWRWVAYQAPDLVVEVRVGDELNVRAGTGPDAEDLPTGSLAAALANPANLAGLGPVATLLATAGAGDGAAVMREVLARARDRQSPLRNVLNRRTARDPLTVARLMARRYPRARPASATSPRWRGCTPCGSRRWTTMRPCATRCWRRSVPGSPANSRFFGNRISFAALAGTMIFSTLAGLPGRRR